MELIPLIVHLILWVFAGLGFYNSILMTADLLYINGAKAHRLVKVMHGKNREAMAFVLIVLWPIFCFILILGKGKAK